MNWRPAIPVLLFAVLAYSGGRYAYSYSETFRTIVLLLRACVGLMRPIAVVVGALLVFRRVQIIRARRRTRIGNVAETMMSPQSTRRTA
ncbi:MAG TPA: hypothetical protein VKT29_03480 [Terriglobales bacterium]|nr:hypothetical protein [Terriglobales bacterium]